MNPLNPLFALMVLIIAFITGYILNRKFTKNENSNRFAEIDGLRGFLAISVFIHHASIWYKYLHTGQWTNPDSILFSHLGITAVVLFFMISSFLFVNKLLEFKGESYDWKNFFMRRFYRLAPLNFFSVAVIIFIVFKESNWIINTDVFTLFKSTLQWFGFGILGLDNINNLNTTSLINAGVMWSLSYEWLLYFSLPLVAIIILKKRPKLFYILISLSFIIITSLLSDYEMFHVLPFLAGAIAPLLLKYLKKDLDFNSKWFSLIVIATLIILFQFHPYRSTYTHISCIFLTAFAFILIALGNSIFGLLRMKTLKFLGEISYSTYLLHGIIIYVMINYVYGLEQTKLLSAMAYCIFIFLTTPIVIIVSFLTYRFVEIPFIKKVQKSKKKL